MARAETAKFPLAALPGNFPSGGGGQQDTRAPKKKTKKAGGDGEGIRMPLMGRPLWHESYFPAEDN